MREPGRRILAQDSIITQALASATLRYIKKKTWPGRIDERISHKDQLLDRSTTDEVSRHKSQKE